LTDREWLTIHGVFTEAEIEHFIERVGLILDGTSKTPNVEWQARLLALSELQKKRHEQQKANIKNKAISA
jgi:hypothetical protein